METFRKGDIVIFPFPYTDLSIRKLRPCLILSNEMNQDILLCQITSKETNLDDFIVDLNADETLDGTLRLDSYIRPNMLFTATKLQIIKKLCKVSDLKYSEVIDKIITLIKN